MKFTLLASLLATAAALFVSAGLEGVERTGVNAGFFLGSGIAGLGLLYQRHTFLHRPERAFVASLVAFQAKLVFLVLGFLAFRYVEAAAALVDWRTFAIAYTAAVLVLLPIGTWEAAQVMGHAAHKLDREPSPQ